MKEKLKYTEKFLILKNHPLLYNPCRSRNAKDDYSV